jgi:Gpi18-like mannosyltransferase
MSSAILAGWYFMKRGLSAMKSFLIFFNIAFIYNTLIWGQVDSMYTAFVIAALIAAFFGNVTVSVVLFLLALNTKLQAIVFFPLVGIILLPQLIQRPSRIFHVIVAALIVEFLVYLPFILHGQLSNALSINSNLVGSYPMLSVNAHNFWYLFFQNAIIDNTNDSDILYLFSYKAWGLILFMASAALTLVPVVLRMLSCSLRRLSMKNADGDIVLLSAMLLTLNLFFFTTEMHERYSHPVVLFSGVYAILTRRYLLYLILSAAYFLNMEQVLRYLQVPYHTLIFQPQFIAALFGIGMLVAYYYLYKGFSLRTEIITIKEALPLHKSRFVSQT